MLLLLSIFTRLKRARCKRESESVYDLSLFFHCVWLSSLQKMMKMMMMWYQDRRRWASFMLLMLDWPYRHGWRRLVSQSSPCLFSSPCFSFSGGRLIKFEFLLSFYARSKIQPTLCVVCVHWVDTLNSAPVGVCQLFLTGKLYSQSTN